MLALIEIVYGLIIWCSPIYLIYRIFFESSRALILTVWSVVSFFFVFVLSFGVGVGITYIFNGSDWEHQVNLQECPNILRAWLDGHWIGDGGYHDIPMWALLLVPYIGIAQWLIYWFWTVFLYGHIILATITTISITIFLRFSIPFLKNLDFSRI